LEPDFFSFVSKKEIHNLLLSMKKRLFWQNPFGNFLGGRREGKKSLKDPSSIYVKLIYIAPPFSINGR